MMTLFVSNVKPICELMQMSEFWRWDGTDVLNWQDSMEERGVAMTGTHQGKLRLEKERLV